MIRKAFSCAARRHTAPRRRRKWIISVTAALCAALLMTGCVGRSRGGELTVQAMQAMEEGEYTEALELLDQALEEGEDEVMVYRGRGIALMGLARYKEAVTSLENALSCTDSRMPETIRDIRLYLISALMRSDQPSRAIVLCDEILQEEENLEACYYMGAAYLKMDDQEQAREYFDRAVACSDRDYNLYLQIYKRYEEQNLTAVGDEYLQTALRIQPETDEDYYRMGQIYFYLERYDDARSILIKPVEDEYRPAMELLGEIYLAQGDYGHAFSIYRSLIDEQGESPLLCNGLALCAIASGDYDAALSYIAQGLSLEEEEGRQQLLFNEIVVYERKLDFAKALEKAEAYMAEYPTDEAGERELRFLNTRGR